MAGPQIGQAPECGLRDAAAAACEAKALRQAESALAAARQGAAQAIAAPDERFESDERKEWRSAFDATMTLWLRFRDARCDKRLIGYEMAGTAAPAFNDASACTLAITRVIAEDVSFRYALGTAEHPRESATRALVVVPNPASDEEGPCADVDPGECDYCGANRCWEKRLVLADRDLNRAWARALQAIRERPGLPVDQRIDWIARLRAAQRAWLAWRDAECALEPWETPNRFAHSIYATLIAPCLEGETLARISDLSASYRLGDR
ncbi:hypothetical protein GCM10009087_28540 [Sphingomonas oligophenolica]